jgi:competence protein ComEA
MTPRTHVVHDPRPVDGPLPRAKESMQSLCSGRLQRLWMQLLRSTWGRPLIKLVGIVVVIAGLTWVGQRSAHTAAVSVVETVPTAHVESGTQPPGQSAPTSDPGPHADGGPSSEARPPPPAGGILGDGRVVLNQATEEELTRIPGIGKKRAAAIVALRSRMGKFRSVRDLLRIKGVGLKMLKKIEPKVVVDRPGEPERG